MVATWVKGCLAAVIVIVAMSLLGKGSARESLPSVQMPKLPVWGDPYLAKNDVETAFSVLRAKLTEDRPANLVRYLQQSLHNISTPKVIISGAPASGKGTQCELLVRAFGFVHISTGDLLRAEIKEGSQLGKDAQGYMTAGKLVPDELVIDLVRKRIAADDVKSRGWLLDGFPRTVGQLKAMEAGGVAADCVVLIQVPDAVVVERVEGRRTDPSTGNVYHVKFRPPPAEVVPRLVQRSDDTREKINERLRQYHANLQPLLTAFSCPVFKIDAGSLPPDVIFDKITKTVQNFRWNSLKTGPRKRQPASA